MGVNRRIEIPESHGRNMMGVVDEIGLLRPGEVFVQYSDSTRIEQAGKHKKILEGT